MDISTFQFSNNAISQRRKILQLLQWLGPVVCGIFALIFTRMRDMTVAFIIFIVITVIFEFEMFFVFRSVIKKLQSTEFLVTSQFVERSVGKSVERINFNEIKSLKIVENPTENLMMVTIFSQKTAMTLAGLDDMENLLGKIESNVVDKSVIDKKTSKFITNKLIYHFVGAAIGAGIVILMFYLGGTVFINFALLLSAFGGLYIMIYRPITRFLGSYRMLEVIGGSLLIFFSFAFIYLLYIR